MTVFPRQMLYRSCVCLVAGSFLIAPVAPAQQLSTGIALGVAIPTGDLGAERLPGPLVHAFVILGSARRIVRLQVGAEGILIRGKRASSPMSSSAEGDLRSLGLLASVLMAPRMELVRPYLTIGTALQRLSIPGRMNPYRTILGARGGLGLEAVWRKRTFRGEVTPHIVLSDFGTGQDWSLGTYVPITLGILF